MKEKLRQQYDSLYGSGYSLYGNGKAIQLIRQLPKLVPSGRVLDIGGGEGRNALYLAKQGYEVSVVDLSRVGIVNLQQSAKQSGLRINTRAEDITESSIDDNYDVILMSFVLHHLNTDEVIDLIAEAKDHTNNNGVHMIATFTNAGALFERNEFKKRFYPNQEQLEKLYADWEILSCEVKETTTRAKDKNGEHMKNNMITFVAQKVH